MADRRRSPMRRTLRLVGPDVKPHGWLIVGGTLSLLLDVAFRVLEPWPMKIVIDAVTSSLGADVSGRPATIGLLLTCGLTLMLIVALRAASNYLATLCFSVIGARAAATLRERAFRHVQGLSLQFHARNRTADTVQRIVGDVARMQEVATTAGLPLLANVVTLLAMVIIMFILDPLLATVCVLAIVGFALVSQGTAGKITSAARRTRKGEGQLANTAQEGLAAMPVVQAYGLERAVAGQFSGANALSLTEGVASRRFAARLERSTDVIVGVATAIVMVGGALRVLSGDITPGDLVLFVTYLRTAMKPLRDMAKYTGRIARASASGERVADLLELVSDVTSPENPVPMGRVAGAVDFQQVRASYEGHQVLHGVDLSIRPGERVAIIGPSGSGKSTLMSLLVRAMDPTTGRVCIDGKPVTQVDLAELRSNISLLHQEAVLFTGTIRSNIRMGRSTASDAEIEAAAVAANAHDFIMRLPDGYDTAVGERGGTLSGGQRQRIAIARALLRDSRIVLLDEATTGLDPAAAALVLDAIDRLAAGRTTLAVTHDAQVVLRATRVVWIESGRIRMDASPQELLATNPVFRAWLEASGRDADSIVVGEG